MFKLSFGKPKLIPRDKQGKFIEEGLPNHFNKEYGSAMIHYLNQLEPLFKKAQKKDEFQFILTLLRFRGMQLTAHDPYENSIKAIDAIMDLEKKMKGHEKTNIFLWVYGHIIESSEPYETIANLLNILNGGGYKPWNFPKKPIKKGKEYINLSPSEKINILDKMASPLGMSEVLSPIKEILDRDLRNAVFHSDYAVNFGEVVLLDPARIYTHQEILNLMNKALAYHEVIKNIINAYTEGYTFPKKIKVSPSFSPDPKEKAQLIIRKNHGLVALKHAWSKKQLKEGKINWFVGSLLPYERKYVDNGLNMLPSDRVELTNKLISFLPNSLRKKAIPLIEVVLAKYA